MERVYLGVDVGTRSARAGAFDAAGRLLGAGVEAFGLYQPEDDFAEHSSDDIWRAVGVAVRAALAAAGAPKEAVRGLGFDATCSLVVVGEGDRPVTVSPTGDDAKNVVVWMDHRATGQAARINATGHEVLRYVGGAVSPEMQTPKLLWLKENLPDSWRRARAFFDLPDFLAYRATGEDVRSLCTTVCKWTYLGHPGGAGFDPGFFRAAGLGELADEGFARVGRRVRPPGERAGALLPKAAAELGLAPGTPVAVAIIDAHAGALGLLGIALDGRAPTPESLEERVALVGGTSTCHLAVSRAPIFVAGVWGPYFSALVPGLWLTEGGQSATGALIDHVLASHARGAELARDAATQGVRPEALLNARLDALARGRGLPAALARELHVLPDHHGNRSPRADPTLRGMVSGLKLSDSLDSLALEYLATVQGLALGTRHVLEAMNAAGYRITTLLATGGDAKNPLFVREHADATGCRVALPREGESVLLGAAMLGAVAGGDRASLLEAMGAMNEARAVALPRPEARAYFDAKYRVYHAMHAHQLAYRSLMAGAGA